MKRRQPASPEEGRLLPAQQIAPGHAAQVPREPQRIAIGDRQTVAVGHRQCEARANEQVPRRAYVYLRVDAW